jgi:Ca2+-binding RTX toxin-like protein
LAWTRKLESIDSEDVDLTDWLFCLKDAEYVALRADNDRDQVVTHVEFGPAGDYPDRCHFFFRGNPFGLPMYEERRIPVTGPDGFAVLANRAGKDATIDGFEYGTAQGPVWRVTGLQSVKASAMLAILSNGDNDAAYRDFVGLFASNDVFRGGASGDRFDPGAGNDRVVGLGGDDIAYKWQPGNITYDGGEGHDVLSFAADLASVAFPSDAVEALRIDLAQGTGRSPWGGKVTLISVEEIRDTDGRDVIFGSRRADTVASDYGGGDVFKLRGGDDTVRLFARAEKLTYDGGEGRDTLVISLGAGDSTLDLGNPGGNAGVFAGARISGVEVISASSIWTGSTFRFVGTAGGEDVTFAAGTFAGTPFARAVVSLGGGGDRGLGGAGDDVIAGGGGRDWIHGGRGDDGLTGGGGGDRFHFIDDFGHDRIRDFDPAADKLDFRDHFGVTARSDLVIRQAGDDVTIGDGAGGLVTLIGVDRGAVGAEQLLV